MSRRPPMADEDGTALVLALVFLSLFGLFVSVILTFADTGVRTTMAMREVDARLYAVDGAVDGALLYVRNDAALGRYDGDCPDFAMTSTNDVPVVVKCKGQLGSGALLPGGGDNSKNKPAQAILTLGRSGEDGIFVQNNTNPAVALNVVGGVRSSSNIAVTSGAMTVDGNITAVGPCSGSLEPLPGTGTKNCNAAPATDPGEGNAAYEAKVDVRPPEVPVPACPAAGDVVMPPGTYTNAAALNTLMASCTRKFVFQGVYYFNFTDTDITTCGSTSGPRLWCVNNGSSSFSILGGTPDPANPGECLPSAPGVQFIFGGDSRVSFQSGKARICAYPETSRQRIAVYAKGKPPIPQPPKTFDPVNVRLEAGTITTGTGNVPKFTNTANAKSIDDKVATETLKKSDEVFLNLSAYAPSIPTDATVDRKKVALLVRHAEPPLGRIDRMTVEITNGEGKALPTVTAGKGATCPDASALCLTDTLKTNTLQIDREDFDSPAEINNARVKITYKAVSTLSGNESVRTDVDAAVFDVTYTPAPQPQPDLEAFPSQSGCVVQSGTAAITSCSLITTDGNNTDVRINGTIYAPHSAVFIKSVNNGTQIIGRGLISRALRVELPGSSNLNEAPIQIPPDSGGSHANRDVVFTARINDDAKLRARAEYDDAQDPPTITVKSWAVLR